MSINIVHLKKSDNLADAHFVRAEVFQKGQGVPASRDFDDLDESAEQFVAYDGDQPVGTARYRIVGDKIGKVERVAVLSSQRGKKLGYAIMNTIEDVAREQSLSKLILESQQSAIGFYESLGYVQEGEVFEDVGIPHVKMSKSLSTE
jgi:predicted GNAT family N-acyltransferase